MPPKKKAPSKKKQTQEEYEAEQRALRVAAIDEFDKREEELEQEKAKILKEKYSAIKMSDEEKSALLARASKEQKVKRLLERLRSLLKTTLGEKLGEEVKIISWNQAGYYRRGYHNRPTGGSGSRNTKETWAFDTENKTVHYPESGSLNIYSASPYEIIGCLLHELGHAKFTGFHPELYDDQSMPKPYLGFVHVVNAFEDIRVESGMSKEFPGAHDFFRNIYRYLDSGVDKAKFDAVPKYVAYLWNVLNMRYGIAPFSKHQDVLDAIEETKPFLPEVRKAKDLPDLVNNIVKPKLWPIVEKLFDDALKNKTLDELIEEALNGQQTQKGGDPNGQYVIKVTRMSSSGTGKSKMTQEDVNLRQRMDLSEVLREMSDPTKRSPENEFFPEEAGDKRKEKGAREKHKGQERLDPNDPANNPDLAQATVTTPAIEELKEEVKVEVNTRSEEMDDNMPWYNYKKFLSYEELYATVQPFISYFARKLRSIMDDNKLIRHGGSFRSGKLNPKMFYKVPCHSDKVFSRPVVRMHREYSVTLVIDESGSMCGEQIVKAAESAVLLAEVLSRCGIAFEVIGFNDTLRQYKKFNEPFNWSIRRNLENVIPACYAEGGATCDAYAINVANYHQAQLPGERIIIVLTDGESNNVMTPIPRTDRKRFAGRKLFLDDFQTDQEVHVARKYCTLIGIGIRYAGVQKTYPENRVIWEVSELPNVVVSLLRKHIRRG